MELRHTPLLVPALAFAGGTAAGLNLTRPLPVASLALLTLLSIALGRLPGRALAWASLGLLLASLRAERLTPAVSGIDPTRPADLIVTVTGHWTAEEDGWSATARLDRASQNGKAAPLALPVLLYLVGDPEDAPEPPPSFGSRLRVRGMLSRSAGFANRATVPPGPWRLRVKSRALLEVEREPQGLDRLSAAMRSRIERGFAAASPDVSPGVALARALVLGDASRIPQEWKRGLRRTGTYHLLSVSGVHVALAGGVVWLLAGFLPRGPRLLAALGAVGLYLLLVGPLPALVRAAVMGALAISALLAERPPASANALAGAALLLIAHRPEVILELGFALSMAATFGLVVLGPHLQARWERRLPRRLARPLAASVGAELAALPWSLARFHAVALLGPLVNLVAVPWMGVVLALSFVWTALALAAPEAARAVAPLLDAAAAPFEWPGRTRPELWLAVPVLASPAAAVAVTLTIAAALLARRWAWRLAAVAGVAAGLGLVLSGPRRGVELILLDVGQGDAVLLRDGRRAALVDGGGFRRGDIGSRVLLPALLAEGVRSLDALVMTHPDDDHCRGLVDIAAHLPVKEVWMGPDWDPAGCAGRLAAVPGARRRLLWAGEEARLGRWRLSVLHPELGERWGENDRSLVLRAEAFGRSALLTGDVERWGEHRLLACCAEQLAADVLKVAHHGSRTSSGESFLEAVRPRLALISAGVGNVYRHPSPEVEERLVRHGARVLVTAQAGEVRVVFEPEGRLRVELPGAPR